MTQPGTNNSGRPIVKVLVARTEGERRAYIQGYIAGMDAYERNPGNVILIRELMRQQLSDLDKGDSP